MTSRLDALSSTRAPAVSSPGHVPGETGIWVFVMGDMIVFALLFATFAFYRGHNLPLYLASQAKLDQNFGAINTLFLLASSWFVVMAVEAARRLDHRLSPRFFLGAMLCGMGFVIVKFLEYGEKIGHGITLVTNEFFMFYYMLTGLHFVHVVVGMFVLVFLWRRSRNPQLVDRRFFEIGATYWHMVDLLWIVLFPLIYLMR